jgi:hypothetical protein
MPATVPPNTFMPRHLAGRDSLKSFTSLAPNYFRVANELRDTAHDGAKWPGHYYVFPAVVIYMASFEAFLQETLTFTRARIEESTDPATVAFVATIDALKTQHQDFKDWIKEIYRLFDRKGVGIDPNSPEFQNLLALKELRNSAIHYNPAFIEHIFFPARLEHALQRTKLEVLNAGWVTNFARAEVVDWARETVKGAIESFCRLSGAENPFTTTAHGALRWE